MKFTLDPFFVKKALEVSKEYILTIRKDYRKHSNDYQCSGLWGMHLEQEELDTISSGILEGIVLSSFGIIHHTDLTESSREILIPVSKNAPKYRLKSYNWFGNIEEGALSYLRPILFNPKSQCPQCEQASFTHPSIDGILNAGFLPGRVTVMFGTSGQRKSTFQDVFQLSYSKKKDK